MIRRRRADPTTDEVVEAIRRNALELRDEARKVGVSHKRMDEIADRMEELVVLLRDAPDREEPNAGT